MHPVIFSRAIGIGIAAKLLSHFRSMRVLALASLVGAFMLNKETSPIHLALDKDSKARTGERAFQFMAGW